MYFIVENLKNGNVLYVKLSGMGAFAMGETPSNGDQSSSPTPFMMTAEAAAYLKLQKRTLDNMRWRSEGPKYRKHGGRVCYHVDDLEHWSRSGYAR